MDRVPPGHDSTSCWGTDREHVIVIQNDSAMRKFIDIRCWYLVGSVETDIIKTLDSQGIYS